jgi:small-conductance mechanosensitive channel
METAIVTAIAGAAGSLFDAVGSVFVWLGATEKTTQSKFNNSTAWINSFVGLSQAETAEEIARIDAQKKMLLYICLIIVAGVFALALIKNKK